MRVLRLYQAANQQAMDSLVQFLTQTAWGRLLLFQMVLFAVAAVISLVAGMLYSTGLMIVGALAIVFRGGFARANLTLETDDSASTTSRLATTPLLVGTIPLTFGVLLSFF